MAADRDLNRTRERIMTAALAEFSAKGLAGARTDAIARRAGVNERMIFYCFETKEGLYREMLRRKLADKAAMVESTAGDDFATNLVKGYESCCSDKQHVRLWQWEALDTSKRKLVAEDERRALLEAQIEQLRRAKQRGDLPQDIDERLLMMVRIGLLIFPVAFPQLAQLITGLDPDDPKFRRKWSKCLRMVGELIAAPAVPGGAPTTGRQEIEEHVQ